MSSSPKYFLSEERTGKEIGLSLTRACNSNIHNFARGCLTKKTKVVVIIFMYDALFLRNRVRRKDRRKYVWTLYIRIRRKYIYNLTNKKLWTPVRGGRKGIRRSLTSLIVKYIRITIIERARLGRILWTP
jgi:hypothetical protein